MHPCSDRNDNKEVQLPPNPHTTRCGYYLRLQEDGFPLPQEAPRLHGRRRGMEGVGVCWTELITRQADGYKGNGGECAICLGLEFRGSGPHGSKAGAVFTSAG